MDAIILAGGRGERLRPLTQDRPKGMVEIGGVPLLDHQVRWLRRQGVRRVVFACGYRHEVIRDYFGDGSRWNLAVSYSIEDEPLGRGGALKQAMAALDGGDLCLATNGDVITTLALEPAVTAHRSDPRISATVVVTPFVSPYGIVDIDQADRVRGFLEKPELPYWINAGIYVLSKDVQALLPDRGDHETTTFPALAAAGGLAAYRSRAFWRGVDTVKDLAETEKALAEGFPQTL